jgi:hypothetical protein
LRYATCLCLILTAIPAIAGPNAIADLRATLAHLTGTTTVRGSLEVTSTSRSSEDENSETGRVTVAFESGADGLRILYARPTLAQANQEARGEAVDPERSTPVRSGLRHVEPLEINGFLDAATALTVVLENAQLLQTRQAVRDGKKAQLVVLKVTPRLTKGAQKHLKKLDSTLSLWMEDDGVPFAAERSTVVKASFLLMSFDSERKESWLFARSGDHLVVTRYERIEKSDGLGQHEQSQIVEALRTE